MRRLHIDFTSQKIDKLTVLSLAPPDELGRKRWICICDCNPNKKLIILDKYLRRGKKNCGCTRKPTLSKDPLCSERALYEIYKRLCAKNRNYSFSLSFEEFYYLTQQNCYYCGIPPNRYYKTKRSEKGFYFNGVDRVNNNIGYEKNNSVSCCTTCNIAKRDYTKEDFKSWVKKCYNHLNLKDNI